jgi:hypothetical protein
LEADPKAPSGSLCGRETSRTRTGRLDLRFDRANASRYRFLPDA